MSSTPWVYRAALRLGTGLTPALTRLSPKLNAGDQGRRGALERLLEWSRRNRDPSRPLVWFHAASVGEGLQAESVILELIRRRPGCQRIYTHFSPSASPLAQRLPVDAADFLPYDLPQVVARLLASLHPDLLVFAKLDLWPELATQAANGGCRVAIVGATVSPGSARLRWPARRLLAAGYRVVAAAAAVSAEDGARLGRLGVPAERIKVLGDPRFDSVVRRTRDRVPADGVPRLAPGAAVLVAGSTWPADEAVLLEAFAELRRRRPEARLIVVPHEPTASHLRGVEQRAAGLGLPQPQRASRADETAALVLVDRVGGLAGLYGLGGMAYVGGGFGSAGLHSVLEPAAWGIPVIFGPRWQNSRDARLLLDAGGAVALPRGARDASRALANQWERWMADAENRAAQGRRAHAVVEGGLGASARSAAWLAELISG
jgi:3-deoxy-D-manno-octulosonic-acid transferase